MALPAHLVHLDGLLDVLVEKFLRDQAAEVNTPAGTAIPAGVREQSTSTSNHDARENLHQHSPEVTRAA